MQVLRRTGPLSTLAGLAIILAACSSSSKTSTPTTPTTVTTAGGSSTPAAAPAAATVKIATNSKLGEILVDNTSGKTLYVFDKDTAGKIACTAVCAGLWPPLRITSGTPSGTGVTAALATVSRPDGGRQVTLGGRPMYTYAGDPAVGDANGDGFMGIWHVARPAGVPVGGSSGATGSATSTSGGYHY
jgi:predicted lipoprotein with Yx(FWY)xxD motif